jgi:hypothetical protein
MNVAGDAPTQPERGSILPVNALAADAAVSPPAASEALQMFRGLVYDATRAEWSGEVYAVKMGEFVPAVIRLSKDGFVLTAGSGFFSRKMTWVRG